jgi:hypothetical protein
MNAGQERAMHRFVIRENIKHYRRLLETTTDASERIRLHELLAAECEMEMRQGHSTFATCNSSKGLVDARPSMPNGASHDCHR